MFRHFKTLKEAKAYIKEKGTRGISLTWRKNKANKTKPFKVGTRLSFLRFA